MTALKGILCEDPSLSLVMFPGLEDENSPSNDTTAGRDKDRGGLRLREFRSSRGRKGENEGENKGGGGGAVYPRMGERLPMGADRYQETHFRRIGTPREDPA